MQLRNKTVEVPLNLAIRAKDIPTIKRLYPNVRSGSDPLVLAFKTASNDTVKCIMDLMGMYDMNTADARANSDSYAQYIPYLFRGNTDWLELFIRTFHIISFKGHESVFCRTAKPCHYKTMLSRNVCFDLQASLRYTIIYGRHSAFEYLLPLVKYQEQLNFIYLGPNGVQQTLFGLCAVTGYYRGLVKLVKRGVDVNILSVNERGESRNGLMAAVDNPQYHKLNDRDQLMIQRCVYYLANIYDISSQNSLGQSALTFAERAGNTDLVKIILELGEK